MLRFRLSPMEATAEKFARLFFSFELSLMFSSTSKESRLLLSVFLDGVNEEVLSTDGETIESSEFLESTIEAFLNAGAESFLEGKLFLKEGTQSSEFPRCLDIEKTQTQLDYRCT